MEKYIEYLKTLNIDGSILSKIESGEISINEANIVLDKAGYKDVMPYYVFTKDQKIDEILGL